MKFQRIGVISNNQNNTQSNKIELIKNHNFIDLDTRQEFDIDLVVALGGDGLMLHLLHKYQDYNIPIYGVNYGTVGFLMNSLSDNILESINKAKLETLSPLKMTAVDINNKTHIYHAINEVSILRQTSQAAKIKIEINNKVRIKNLTADGVLVCTPAGSTAYNSSVNGPIIPLKAKILGLTPISAFRPKGWGGALVPSDSKIKFYNLNNTKRPISATADFFEVRNVKEIEVENDESKSCQILFDPNHSLEERIITEQFL